MPCKITKRMGDDNSTLYLTARFRRDALQDPLEATVEIIWEIYWPDIFNAPMGAVALDQMSCTRVDNRTPISLTREEMKGARDEALDYAAGDAEGW